MRNKYGARKLTAPDGQVFDSVKEYQRWGELKILQRAGAISDLRRQVTYELIPKQRGERACNYIADFVYVNDKGETIVEDSKGYKTEVYRLKKKLMLWVHGIRIKET
jgi:hypothetical protein